MRDFNAIHSPWLVPPLDYSARKRHNVFVENCRPYLFRVNTGTSPTRPANRSDAINNIGAIIDHILVANADAVDGDCLDNSGLTSDHHPIVARVLARTTPQTIPLGTGESELSDYLIMKDYPNTKIQSLRQFQA